MGFYARHVLPRLVHLACGVRPVERQRLKLVPLARGRVLEVGCGSGFNLPHYDAGSVEHVWALEPSLEMWKLAAPRVAAASVPVEHLEAPAQKVPLPGDAADSVVVTYTLCTLPDVASALAEVRRVLRPGGRLLFCEHGRAPDASVRWWQDRADPVWTRLAGGCHLNRAIPELLEEAGLRIDGMETRYLPGWRPASYNYWGSAVDPDR